VLRAHTPRRRLFTVFLQQKIGSLIRHPIIWGWYGASQS
jgi:hypothetical protein